MAATMAVVLIIGPYFSGHLRPEASLLGRASMLSNMRYHTAVIISLFSACGSLAASSRKMMKLTAYAERLQQLEDVAREISTGAAGENYRVFSYFGSWLELRCILGWGTGLLFPASQSDRCPINWYCTHSLEAGERAKICTVGPICTSMLSWSFQDIFLKHRANPPYTGNWRMPFVGTAVGSLAATAEGRIEATEDEIAFEGAQVVTPANATLVQDLNLRYIRKKESCIWMMVLDILFKDIPKHYCASRLDLLIFVRMYEQACIWMRSSQWRDWVTENTDAIWAMPLLLEDCKPSLADSNNCKMIHWVTMASKVVLSLPTQYSVLLLKVHNH